MKMDFFLLALLLTSIKDRGIVCSGDQQPINTGFYGISGTRLPATDNIYEKEREDNLTGTENSNPLIKISEQLTTLESKLGASSKPIHNLLSSQKSHHLQSAIINPMPKEVENYKDIYTPGITRPKENVAITEDSNETLRANENSSSDVDGRVETELSSIFTSLDNHIQQYENSTGVQISIVDSEDIINSNSPYDIYEKAKTILNSVFQSYYTHVSEDQNTTREPVYLNITQDFTYTTTELFTDNTSFVTLKGIEGTPTTITEQQHLLQIPYCCFDTEKYACPNVKSQMTFTIPVALSHCKPPRLQPVFLVALRNTSCSSKNRLKIAINEDSKIVSTDRELVFSFNHVFIPEFCVEQDPQSRDQWWVVVCSTKTSGSENTDSCSNNNCFRKCCPEGYILHNNSCKCHEGSSLYTDIAYNIRSNTGKTSYNYTKFGMPECEHTSIQRLESEIALEDYSQNADTRTVIMREEFDKEIVDYFCLEEVLEDFRNNKTYFAELSCHEPKEGLWQTLRRILIPAGLAVSCAFLICTLMCQLCVAPLRDLHGLCMAAYMGALLSADASLFTIKLYAGELTPSACIGVGMTVYVSFLSTFMWLNVICFDIWKYVGQTVQAVPLYQSPRDFRWFLAYGGYAWGVPFIIGLVVGGLQGHNPRHELTLMPHFALHNCWFEASEFWGTLLFFYGPIGILLSVNTVFIVHTGLRLYSLHHSCCFRTSHQRDQQSQHRPHLNEFWERFTLFAILACCWGTELISWLSGSGDSVLWAMTDTINAFQGVFIFFIFLKSSKKRRLVKHSVKKLLSTLRQESSSSWRSLGFTQSKPEHLINHLRHTTPNSKAFSHIFSKEKLSNMSSCENIIHDEDSKDDDVGREANSSWLFDGNNGSSVWTTQWKSFRSDFYFPATGETSADILGNSEDLFFKSSCNLQSICSPYSEGSDTENKPEVILQPERSSFPSWNFMRSRSGSITLRQERNLKGSDEDVVCQKLERKDNLGYI